MGGPSGCFPPKNPRERMEGEGPPHFPVGFGEVDGRLDPQKTHDIWPRSLNKLREDPWEVFVERAEYIYIYI